MLESLFLNKHYPDLISKDVNDSYKIGIYSVNPKSLCEHVQFPVVS